MSFFQREFPLRLLWALFLGFCMLPLYAGQSSSELLGDRMIVEINGKSFSQRQLELFFLVRETLQDHVDLDRALISESRWNEALDIYVGEMTLALEADRVGSSAISQDQLERMKIKSKNQRQALKPLAQRIRSLQASQQHIDSMILTIIKIETLRTFKRQSTPPKALDDQRSNMMRQPEPWTLDIYSRSSIRYYVGAREYKNIHTQDSP